MHCFSGSWWAGAVLAASWCVAEGAHAHVVPNMTVEADFSLAGSYTLRINVDPRTFLATDPTTLPPVPGSWYREQTPEQVAATHEKAQQYLRSALGLLFNNEKVPLPDCQLQAMDGADNTPLNPDTQEVHLLATVQGRPPEGATTFRLDFAKDANTSMILLLSHEGRAEPRPQVVFPGEVSRPFQLTGATSSAAARPSVPQPGTETGGMGQFFVALVTAAAGIALIIGWRLLNRYRHYHRGHGKARSGGM
jgi:hypothetical protein